jgi:16S rRNA processing protein RimM
MLEIERPSGQPLMLPFTRAVVPTIDLTGGILVVDPPPGLLDPVREETPAEPVR